MIRTRAWLSSLQWLCWLWLSLGTSAVHAAPQQEGLAALAGREWRREQAVGALGNDPDPRVRSAALEELIALRDSEVAAVLAATLREDPEVALRRRAAQALAALRLRAARAVLVERSTADPSAEVRAEVAALLARPLRALATRALPLEPRPFAPPEHRTPDARLLGRTLALPTSAARLWAIQALAERPCAERRSWLERHLVHDPAAAVRTAAGELLQRLGQPPGLPLLLAAAHDASPTVRLAVLRLIATLDEPRALDTLERLVGQEQEAQVKAEARVLLEPSTAVGRRLLARRLERLRATDAAQRIVALGELGQVALPQTIQPMACVLLRDPALSVRTKAADVLSRLHDRGALLALRIAAQREANSTLRELVRERLDGLREHVNALLAQLQNTEASKRLAAAELLGQAAYPPALGPLSASTQDPDPRVRLTAVLALAGFPPSRVREPLERAAVDRDPPVRAAAVQLLQRGAKRLEERSALAVDEGRRSVADPSARRRAETALVLGLRGAGQAAASLEHLLQDKAEEVRLAAAWALALRGDARSRTALEHAVAGEANTQAQLRMQSYLSSAAAELDVLVRQLGDPRPSARLLASEALALRAEDRVLVPLLAAASCDGEDLVRAAALRGLARLHNPLAEATLQLAEQRDPSPAVRRMAYLLSLLREQP